MGGHTESKGTTSYVPVGHSAAVIKLSDLQANPSARTFLDDILE